MTSTLRRPLTFAAHERATIGDSKFSFTDSDHLGWLKCDGRLLSKTEYALLYTVIGDKFGEVGDQFRLPDSRGRVPGAAGRSEANADNPTTYVKGDISGNQLHQLIIAEMPRHTHGPIATIDGADGTGVTSTIGNHTHSYLGVQGQDAGTLGGQTSVAENDPRPTETSGAAGSHNHDIGSTGDDQYHNNMQPTIFMGNLFIFCGIYSKGIYPYTTGYGVF